MKEGMFFIKHLYNKTFHTHWHPYVALLFAGILSAVYFGATGGVWAVTGEFTRFGGHLLRLFGINISDWAYFDMVGMEGTTLTRSDGWMIWGMFIGALIMVLMSNHFKIRLPRQKRRYVQGLVGGIVAGFGARMALGCNLAALFTGVPQFSIHSWIFIVAMGLGTYLGSKLVQTRWWKGKPALSKGNQAPSTTKSKKRQPAIGIAIALLYAMLIIAFFATGHPMLGFGAMFGAFFGILIERGQICFTSAFRDLWLMGRGVMAKAIIAGMAISSVITIIIISVYGMPPITHIAAPSTLIGGVLFGLGIVMASSCETGMMYRLMEGQVLYLPVFVGNIIGATFLAYAWDHLGIYNVLAASGSEINLVPAIGPVGAIAATLVMLAVAYGIVIWREHGHTNGFKLKREMNSHASPDAN